MSETVANSSVEEASLVAREERATEQDAARGASAACVSVIVPVKNEEESIEPLLRALIEQSYSASEIIITDGGSTDGTRQRVRAFQKGSPVPIILIEAPQAFPGRGRNLAIAHATYNWVASVDAGIVPEREWLRELIEAARAHPEARIIYGKFEPAIDNYFAECAAIVYLAPPEEFTPCIASSLIHRAAWKAAGGMREDLRSAEDLLFFRRIEEERIPTARAERAIVRWSLQSTAHATFRRFATYSRYNIKAGIWRNWQLGVARFYALICLSLAIGLLLWSPFALIAPALLLMRTERRINRWMRAKPRSRRAAEMLSLKRVAVVTWIALLIDAATLYGVWLWLKHDYFKAASGG